MSFEEVIPSHEEEWVRFHVESISISKKLRDKYFDSNKIRIFIDKENSLLGLKSGDEGYTLFDERIMTKKLRGIIENGYYPAEWSEEHEMLIAKIILTTSISSE